jgi:hypothetical protein
MPVEYVDATLIHHDGERSEVIFLLPAHSDVLHYALEGDAFIPAMREAKICIVARESIAAIGLPLRPLTALEAEMPNEKQLVVVKLRSGMMIEGELRWTVVFGGQRTTDQLNNADRTFELRTADKSYYVVKAHVAYVQEM